MLKSMTLEENLDRLFYLTAVLIYSPEDFIDRNAVFQFTLTHEGIAYDYILKIENRGIREFKGRYPNADVVIETTAEDWMGICNQTVNSIWSVMSGKTKVKGDMALFKALGRAMDVHRIRFQDEIEAWEKPNGDIWKKPDNVLVINGSPRMNEGYTDYYLQHLLDGIRKEGVSVDEINVYDKNIHFQPCKGCFACWEGKYEGNCVQRDDANDIVKRIFESYLTVYAFPVYVDSVPARLKALLDRQFITQRNQFSRFGDSTRHLLYHKPKERFIAVFATNGFPEAEHFEPISAMFKGNARNFRSPLAAEIFRPGATALYEDPTLYPHLLKVQQALEIAGAELVKNGYVSNTLQKCIGSLPKGYTKDTWYFMSGKFNKLERKRPAKIESPSPAAAGEGAKV